MLTPEQARQALKKFQRDESEEAERIARLPSLEQSMLDLVCDVQAIPDWGKIAEALDSMGSKHRRRVFGAVQPNLARELDLFWEFTRELPYQASWSRRGFRTSEDMDAAPLRVQRLRTLLVSLRGYAEDIEWVARWAAHIPNYWAPDAIGLLLAATMNGGGSEATLVRDILERSIEGTDDIAAMGRHVTRAYLSCGKPECWQRVEDLLRAAQREEGFRQSVFESIDEAAPGAFRQMIGCILDENLLRFSSALRAVGVWLAMEVDPRGARDLLVKMAAFLDSRDEALRAINSGRAETCYVGLWCVAHSDAREAYRIASALLDDPDPERRFVAAYLISELSMEVSSAGVRIIEDPDLRVAVIGFDLLASLVPGGISRVVVPALESLLERLPETEVKLDSAVWPWTARTLKRADVGSKIAYHGQGTTLEALVSHLDDMDADGRARVAARMGRERAANVDRDTLHRLLGDQSEQVRAMALESAGKLKVVASDAPRLEALLTRTAADLRRGVIRLLVSQKDAACLASAERLLASSSQQQRLAGGEVLRQLLEQDRAVDRARTLLVTQEAGARTAEERAMFQRARVADDNVNAVTLDDCLGLLDGRARTERVPLGIHKVDLMTRKAVQLIASLDSLVHEHRHEQVEVQSWSGATEVVQLPEAQRAFWPRTRFSGSRQADVPLAEIWLGWWNDRGDDQADLIRAAALLQHEHVWHGIEPSRLRTDARKLGFDDPRYQLVAPILNWLVVQVADSGTFDTALDLTEAQLVDVTEQSRDDDPTHNHSKYLNVAREIGWDRSERWSAEQHRRLWNIERCLDEGPLPAAGRRGLRKREPPQWDRSRPPFTALVTAYQAGVATDGDVIDHLVGVRPKARPGSYSWSGFHDLKQASGRRTDTSIPEGIRSLVDEIRHRVVEVELGRGEEETPATPIALALRYTGGTDVVVRILASLGAAKFTRGWSHDGSGRAVVFSRMLRVTAPADDDTPEAFARAVSTAGIKERRLVDVGAYAPQWAAHIEVATGVKGLASAIWWLHAHTKGADWTVDSEVRAEWQSQVAERTILSGEDLVDGAVDVDWFSAVYKQLGAERWKLVDAAAKYSSTSGGHKRAQLFADAIRGSVTERELIQRIVDKRHKDAACALGLLPLPRGAKRDATLLRRYEVLQEFVRTSRQFGAQRQASEKRATEIGLGNLARTAGYADPLRLSWAMEADAVRDIAEGQALVTRDDVIVQLRLDATGAPEVQVSRGDKVLKAVPAALRKDPEVKALRERATSLRRQSSRIRDSLEHAMMFGDTFVGDELATLAQHAMLWPRLSRLVLVGEDQAGFPDDSGRGLVDPDGNITAIGRDEILRIAHPLDLQRRGDWHEWQRAVFARGLVQPFKQVFRELYVVTSDEAAVGDGISRRYAGHQLMGRRGMGVLNSRGWVAHHEEGIRRTYHREGITANLWFLNGWFTPADVEDLTLEGVSFHRSGEYLHIELANVPPRLFSEVMRDVDLLVSVAHSGAIDPEASQSTLEMRSALVTETARLLGLANVRIDDPWVLVDGKLGEYSIHLGSGTVHRRPGGHVFIVPVGGQHHGRLFLPFADDDPKTAEVLSKVLLLANDDKIKDPSILEQIRHGG